jgi:GT2 family glycosyltransferase
LSNRRKLAKTQPQPTRSGGVVIGYIHPGQVSSYFLESMLTSTLTDVGMEMAGQRPRRIVNILQEWSSANVSASRNTVTQRFLDQPHGDWLLWVDSDMQWEPDAIDQLLAAADPDERPIVGGLCFGMSKAGLYPTIYQWAEIDGKLTTVRVGQYPRASIVRCAATGAAFLLIHRRVLEAMRDRQFDRAFPFFQESAGNGAPVGEDITFCIRAGILGFPVHVHTGVRIGHHKSNLLTEELFDQQQPAGLPADVGLVIPTRGDHPELLRAVVATSGLPPERVVIVSNGSGPLPDADIPAVKIHDPGEVNIHRWWNTGINHLAAAGCTRVAILNDDVVIAPDTLPRLARGIGGATLALAYTEGPSGHCFMLNVTHGVRPDESFRWYSGDLQLIADAQRANGVVRVPEAWCLHLHPMEATKGSPELQALAAADDALYDSRHPAGSPFVAVRR